MARCTFKNYNGDVCNIKSDKLEYVLLHDPHGRVTLERNGCALHMNIIIDDLMVREMGYTNQMKACFKRIEKIDEQINKGSSLTEERDKIRNAKADGLPAPKMKKIEELKIEKQEFWTQIKNCKKILQQIRNKTCVFCQFPLRDPEFPQDQIGYKFSNADFKGVQGYRRFDALFHTECFITWYSNKFALDHKELKYIQPIRTGQTKMFDTILINNDS